MLYFLVICAVYIVPSFAEDGERPCDITELPCDHRGCILRLKWCDGVSDCKDSSDEAYCFNKKPCLPHHFRCNDGTCIPLSAKCDTYEDCKDGSDEICEFGKSFAVHNDAPHKDISPVIDAAVKWVLNQRKSDGSWGDKTPRAVVALAFAGNVVKMSTEEKNLIAKRLNILLTLDLMRNRTHKVMSPSELALYINALYATCQDPTNFQGVDLIGSLRHQTNVAVEADAFSLPITMLTLCFARRSTPSDIKQLTKFYWRMKKDKRDDAKAIAVMALACLKNSSATFNHHDVIPDFHEIVQDFKRDWPAVGAREDIDFYTKALYLQALISIGFSVDPTPVVEYQKSYGSFKDLLATYYAMPLLVDSSLSSLPKLCKESLKSQLFEVPPMESSRDVSKVTYSIWIGSESDKNIHTMEITFSGNKTLFDLMKIAESRDKTFRFLYEDTGYEGKKVYSVAGVPDDAERGVFWKLYSGNGNRLSTSLNNPVPETIGLDKIFPQRNQSFIFWLNTS